jgi:glycogen(starch) synthase
MRILFISNLYPPHEIGGLEQICQEVVGRLQERGHICHVLTSDYGIQRGEASEDGVSRSLHLQADIHYYRPFAFFFRRPWQEWANRQALHRAIKAFKPDIVFVWGMWNLSPRVACWAEKWMPERVAYNVESYWPLDIDPHIAYWRDPSKRPLIRLVLWPFAKLALALLKVESYPPRPKFRHVSCCSQYVVDVLVRSGAIPPGAVAILNGIDPTPFISQQRQKCKPNMSLRLLYFGGLLEHKGVHTAIEALGILQQQAQVDGMRLTIVGGGPPDYEARLCSLTRSLDLEDKVHFVGQIPRTEIPHILANHDVFLFTSIWAEPFGRTIIEAMAAGLAVIGADVGGSKEIFRFYPENMLFEPGNAESLAAQIQRLIDAPDLVDRLGEAGQRLVLEHFTLGRMVDEIEHWLEEIVG